MSGPDVLGMVGVAVILTAYALLQSGRLAQTARAYSAMNAVGASLVLVSLYFDFNLPSAVIESAWLVISLYGLVKHWKTSRSRPADDIC